MARPWTDHSTGTTSACAENTPRPEMPALTTWNYLRVRGEYGENQHFCVFSMELPPRARRIRGGERDT